MARTTGGRLAAAAKRVTASVSRRSSDTTRAAASKKAAPGKKAAAAKKASPAKKSAAVKKAAAAKKAPATKAPVKKAPAAKKAAPTKAPAKKAPAAAKRAARAKQAPAAKKAAPAKKTPAKKTAAKTTPTKTTTTAKATPVKKAAPAKRAPAATSTAKKPAALASRSRSGSQRLAVKADEKPWTAKELDEVRTELLADRDRLRAELNVAEHDLADLMRDAGDGAGNDQADVGSTTFERDHEMSLANNARDMLTQTEHALERIADGTYGVCESCGQPIGKMRLMAFPRATLCLSCKQREERR
jgi:RNA polymerase-binding protein DksA